MNTHVVNADEWLLLAVCEGGSAYVWECLPEPGNPKALTHHLRAHVTTPPAADGNPSTSGIVAAYLEAGGDLSVFPPSNLPFFSRLFKPYSRYSQGGRDTHLVPGLETCYYF
jgi:hypothetical protein